MLRSGCRHQTAFPNYRPWLSELLIGWADCLPLRDLSRSEVNHVVPSVVYVTLGSICLTLTLSLSVVEYRLHARSSGTQEKVQVRLRVKCRIAGIA